MLNDRAQTGFTFLELLCVCAVFAILLFCALPSFRHFFSNNREALDVNNLVSALQFARSEAIKRRSRVKICKSSDHENCGGKWKDGQIVVDIETGKVLRVFPPITRKNRLKLRGNYGDVCQLTFSRLGGAPSSHFEYYPDVAIDYSYDIIITRTGRIRVVKIK